METIASSSGLEFGDWQARVSHSGEAKQVVFTVVAITAASAV